MSSPASWRAHCWHPEIFHPVPSEIFRRRHFPPAGDIALLTREALDAPGALRKRRGKLRPRRYIRRFHESVWQNILREMTFRLSSKTLRHTRAAEFHRDTFQSVDIPRACIAYRRDASDAAHPERVSLEAPLATRPTTRLPPD